jgi:hypothetical protein
MGEDDINVWLLQPSQTALQALDDVLLRQASGVGFLS